MFNDKKIIIREIKNKDYSHLEEFLFYSIHQIEHKLPKEIIYSPEVYLYIGDYGKKDDNGVIAEVDGKILGMAWTRIISGYGHIDNQTPELAISVSPKAQGFGIGTKLMNELFRILKTKGYKQTSLAVQKTNRAVNFYKKLGYQILLEKEEEFIMVKKLL